MASRSEGGLGRHRRALVALAVVIVATLVITGLVLWSRSPVERLTGSPDGHLTQVGQNVPPGPARHVVRADDPVLVSGAAVVLDGTTVRAVRLSDGHTYWKLTRPGGVTPQSLWSIDDSHVAVIWSDGRLTVVDVPTGTHWDVYPASFPLPVADYPPNGDGGAEVAVYGLPAAGGNPARLVFAQPGRILTYDLNTGRPSWSFTPPSGQVVEYPAGDVSTTGDLLVVDLSDGYDDYTHSVLLGGAGRIAMRLALSQSGTGGYYLPVGIGDGRVAAAQGTTEYIFDGASGHVLEQVPMGDGPQDIAGGGGVIVTAGREDGPVSAYDASDGRLLWRHQYTAAGPTLAGTEIMDIAVYGGQVRLLELYGGSRPGCLTAYRLLTVNAAGKIVGTKPLDAFDCQPLDIFPRFIQGRDGALVVADNASIARGQSDRFYIYVG